MSLRILLLGGHLSQFRRKTSAIRSRCLLRAAFLTSVIMEQWTNFRRRHLSRARKKMIAFDRRFNIYFRLCLYFMSFFISGPHTVRQRIAHGCKAERAVSTFSSLWGMFDFFLWICLLYEEVVCFQSIKINVWKEYWNVFHRMINGSTSNMKTTQGD